MPDMQIRPVTETEEWSSGIRRWQRYKIDMRLKLTASNGNDLRTYAFGRGTDISEGGLAAYVCMDLKIGKQVELELTLPYSEHPIRLKAVVRDRRDFCYGLEFIAPGALEKEAILRTCRALSLVQ